MKRFSMRDQFHHLKKRFDTSSRNQKFIASVIGFLIVGAVLLFVFGDGWLSNLLQQINGFQPVTVSKYRDKVSPHRKAAIARFQYNPSADTLTPAGVEETYLEVPPFEAAKPLDSSDTHTFELEVSRPGKQTLKGWRTLKKSQLEADARGNFMVNFVLPSESGATLQVKNTKTAKPYLGTPTSLNPVQR